MVAKRKNIDLFVYVSLLSYINKSEYINNEFVRITFNLHNKQNKIEIRTCMCAHIRMLLG